MSTPVNALPVGTVVVAKYTYGLEILHYKFFAIVGYTAKKVRIQELDALTTYDDGREGPHYYDDPKHIQPVVDTQGRAYPIGGSKLVNYKISEEGKMSFKPEEFYRFNGVWNGKPLEVYNLH